MISLYINLLQIHQSNERIINLAKKRRKKEEKLQEFGKTNKHTENIRKTNF